MQPTRLYLGNLPFTVTEEELRALLAPYTPSEIKIGKNPRTDEPRGFAHASVKTRADAERAIADLDGKRFQGRRLVCAPANPRGQNGPDFSRRTDLCDNE